MSESPHKKQDFLDAAKHQFAQLSDEFQKALDTLKDPEHRKQVTSSYLDMLHKGLSKAQDAVAKYQDKIAAEPNADPRQSALSADEPVTPEPNAAPAEPPPVPSSNPPDPDE